MVRFDDEHQPENQREWINAPLKSSSRVHTTDTSRRECPAIQILWVSPSTGRLMLLGPEWVVADRDFDLMQCTLIHPVSKRKLANNKEVS